MILGMAIGVGIMILLILAFMVGYGFADQKHNSTSEEKE